MIEELQLLQIIAQFISYFYFKIKKKIPINPKIIKAQKLEEKGTRLFVLVRHLAPSKILDLRNNRYRQHVKYLSNVIGRTTNKETEIGEEIDGVGARLRGEVDQKTRSVNSFLWMPYRRSRKLETVPNDSSSPVEFSIIFTALWSRSRVYIVHLMP